VVWVALKLKFEFRTLQGNSKTSRQQQNLDTQNQEKDVTILPDPYVAAVVGHDAASTPADRVIRDSK
jgi:hypothetical protein